MLYVNIQERITLIKEPCLNYGEKIEELRVQRGLTLKELAFITETNEMTIRNLEKSLIHPTNHFIEKVAKAQKRLT